MTFNDKTAKAYFTALICVCALILEVYIWPAKAAETVPLSDNVELISLPLQMHLLSSTIPQLHAQSSKSDVAVMLKRINAVWAKAGIRWDVQKITVQPIGSEDEIVTTLSGSRSSNGNMTRDSFLNAIVGSAASVDVWNVYLVHDLSALMGAPGMYLPSHKKLIISELDPAGLNDPGRIAAHELGHSLSLAHTPCVSEGNLMSPACPSVNRTRLKPGQILDARKQAMKGQPISYK